MQPLLKQSGFSLIEILVTVLLLSIGLLGLTALQLNGLKQNQNALQLTNSTFFAYEIADRMRANRADALAGRYVIAFDATAQTGTLYGDELVNWKNNLAAQLPSGDGRITVAGDVYSITIRWDDSKGLAPLVEYQVETQL